MAKALIKRLLEQSVSTSTSGHQHSKQRDFHLAQHSKHPLDVDLDVLEKVVSIIAFGDIEAEDTRYLTELNFLKVFRLAQLIIEYLLYVQDCLQSTNAYLQQHRCGAPKMPSPQRPC
ncbi:Iguana/Dzip1-like DAZ-interacting protein N-terminal-domain-containing protein [Dunaliella salina]|uniref:Iguana/Dzip1-like DAZ-interacting protein N-terminal-domain-containing protein n=1 Tax=Dunaliella salina TaxID=3046 RepID=A0ABQ7GTH2_DUNSA|nr:Iguana/Dzip1-like DAZ-interacting protein N-terminal-domain-containing protein [Dunaliella salina]|eukprot:KAF5837877.1 Iguana/Dzip1-like DAZ-interacting protein N-terminal-domain-containing protein [Dunaliella salina]